jgi:hypothetical protein
MEVSHTGGLPGMLSRTVLIPDLDLGIVVLTNTEPGGGGVFAGVSRTLVDRYLSLDDYGWVKRYADYLKQSKGQAEEVVNKVWETVAVNKKTKIDKTNYIGTYEDAWFGKIDVFDKNGTLWMKCLRSPKLNGPMSFYKANTFVVKWEYQDMNADVFAMFGLDENGQAIRLKMKGISPEIDFSFDFQDLDLHRLEKE